LIVEDSVKKVLRAIAVTHSQKGPRTGAGMNILLGILPVHLSMESNQLQKHIEQLFKYAKIWNAAIHLQPLENLTAAANAEIALLPSFLLY
jgi:hypothetical protein